MFKLRKLCPPAFVYLILSVITIVFMGIQNFGNTDKYCLGQYSCTVSSTILIFMFKILYILLWTWILNLICKAGGTPIAWLLVLLPYLLLFLLFSFLMIPV